MVCGKVIILLDSEYRKVRFNDEKELFENYITDKKEQLEQASMVSYSVSYNGYDIESIVIKDNFGNYYIIKENGSRIYFRIYFLLPFWFRTDSSELNGRC